MMIEKSIIETDSRSHSRVFIIDSRNKYGVLAAVSTERLLALMIIKQSAILRCVWWPGCWLVCPVGLLGGQCDCRSFAGQDSMFPPRPPVEGQHYQRLDDAVMCMLLHPCSLIGVHL